MVLLIQDIVEFVLFPMVNEGLRCLDDKIIETAPQIDLMLFVKRMSNRTLVTSEI